MREYKFRFWDSKNSIMSEVDEVFGCYEFIKDGDRVRSDLDMKDIFNGDYPEIIPMQFTGLKDKNGKDIYEGDILQIETANSTIVKMACAWGTVQRKMDTGWIVDITGFHFYRTDGLAAFPIVQNWAGKRDLDMLEIIGNLYETPELIDK